jgi:hypothetical protein
MEGGMTYDQWKTRSPDDDAVEEYEHADDEPPFICPVTGQVCMTEQNEFCEDYGCARLNGIDVDEDLYP